MHERVAACQHLSLGNPVRPPIFMAGSQPDRIMAPTSVISTRRDLAASHVIKQSSHPVCALTSSSRHEKLALDPHRQDVSVNDLPAKLRCADRGPACDVASRAI